MGTVSAIRRVIALPWLCPSESSLLALTDDHPPFCGGVERAPGKTVLLQLRDDPAIFLLAFRSSWPTPDSVSFQFDESLLTQPGLCHAAADLLDRSGENPGVVDGPALGAGRSVARTAAAIAERTGICSADAAWGAGLLMPLGWYALQAIGMNETDSTIAVRVGRRLANRWRLPTWLAVTIGFPDIAVETAVGLGGHAGLHRVVMAATNAVIRAMPAYAPYLTASTREDADLANIASELVVLDQRSSVAPAQTPDQVVYARLLRATGLARQHTNLALVSELEATIDRLTSELADARRDFDHALRDAKLDSLAEFAAGASHEINNPLAVIAGNAQLLESHETDPTRRKSLDAIRRQTRRIHDILLGVRQFARPPVPKFAMFELGELLVETIREFETVLGLLGAESPEVRFPTSPVWLNADRKQLRQVFIQLLRNASDAAGADGTIRLSAEVCEGSCEISIEDSGSGPDTECVPHLFDPFFSGRSAGRGRGLGLSIAWRFARINGGDVRYAPRPGSPSRFVVTIPQAVSDLIPFAPDRLSA